MPIATNEFTGATDFQDFSGFRCHYWRLSCSNMHSYGMSRLVSLVCSVFTLSDQLQATAPPGADTAYLWACFSLVQSLENLQGCALLLFKCSRQCTCTSDLLSILPRSCCIFMAYNMLLSTFSRYCKVYAQCSGD